MKSNIDNIIYNSLVIAIDTLQEFFGDEGVRVYLNKMMKISSKETKDVLINLIITNNKYIKYRNILKTIITFG